MSSRFHAWRSTPVPSVSARNFFKQPPVMNNERVLRENAVGCECQGAHFRSFPALSEGAYKQMMCWSAHQVLPADSRGHFLSFIAKLFATRKLNLTTRRGPRSELRVSLSTKFVSKRNLVYAHSVGVNKHMKSKKAGEIFAIFGS